MEEYRAGIYQAFKISWHLTQLTAVSADLLPRVSGSSAWHSEIARSSPPKKNLKDIIVQRGSACSEQSSQLSRWCLWLCALCISVRITYLIAYLIVIHLTHNFVCYEILHNTKKNNDKICVDYNICS